MTEVARFELAEGSTVLVEVDGDNLGIERVSRGRDGVVEVGAIIAKTAAEGHFTVRLTWAPDTEASNGSQIA